MDACLPARLRQFERFLFGATSVGAAFAALRLPGVQLEIEVEQLFEEVGGSPRPIVERDRFFADQQGGIREPRLHRLRRLPKILVQRIRLHNSCDEAAVSRRSVLEGDLLVPDAPAAY